MRVVYDHNFGLQTQAEVYHFNATLVDVDEHEHDFALSTGWLATAKASVPVWYQCRSTRCDLSKCNYSMLASAAVLDTIQDEQLDAIYTEYCKKRGYKKYFEVNESLDWDKFIGYTNKDSALIAWSKLREYSKNSIETVLFAWDYAEPDLKLGLKSLEHELAWAKQIGYQYVYMGPGYETSSIYKSRMTGFEWWTGAEWSSDTDKYTWLCQRDSKISRCADLHGL